jgi:hypothetical protein
MADKLTRLRALCAADPTNAFAWYTLAMEEKKIDPKGALLTFRRVHDEHPEYVPSYYHYAKTLEENGDEATARAIYREGMKVAKAAGDQKTHDELEAALDLLG